MEQLPQNTIIRNEATATNANGSLVLNASFVIFIRRKSDDKYWTGLLWQTARVSIVMAEVSETNLPGIWRNSFDSDADAEPLHNAEDTYYFEMIDTSNISVYPIQKRVVEITDANFVTITQFVWNAILTGATFNINNSAGKILRQLKEGFGIDPGLAQDGSLNTITLQSGESSINDFFIGRDIAIVAGTGIGQIRIISDYDGASKVATITGRDWDVTPNGTSEYIIIGTSESIPVLDFFNIIRDAILADATKFNGADIPLILADTGPILADTAAIEPLVTANLNATILSRSSQVSVDAIQNNTRFVGIVPKILKLPTSGSKSYKFYGRLFNTNGSPEDPDSNTMNVRIEDISGSIIVATTAMTRTAQGNYEFIYVVNSSDQEKPLVVFMEYDENTVFFNHPRTTEVAEFESTLDSIANEVSQVLADTNETQQKLPDDNIMGSVVKTSKDDEIDNIDSLVTTNLNAQITTRAVPGDEMNLLSATKDDIVDRTWAETLSAKVGAETASEILNIIRKLLTNKIIHDTDNITKLFDDGGSSVLGTRQDKDLNGNVLQRSQHSTTTPVQHTEVILTP